MDSNSFHHTPAKRRLQDNGCSGDNKLPQRFFEKGREPSFEKSIVYHSNGDLMNLMATNLGDSALKHISGSPLGMFYKFYQRGFTWASRIVQHTLSYQIECQKPYEIWCVFGRHPTRFSVTEFEAITHLNCDNIPDLICPKAEVTDEEKEKFYGFWKKLKTPADRGPNKKSLQLALGSCKEWEEEDKIRLGYLSIYVQYIQGMGPRDNSNLELTKMVMNIEQFERYPWGRVAFYYLIKSVKELNMCQRQLTLKGFVQALQVWVYMALPEFGEKYGSKIPVSEIEDSERVPILSYLGSYKRKNFAKAMMKHSVKTCCFLYRKGQDDLPPWEDDVPDKKIDELVCMIREKHPFAESDWSGKGVYDDGFPRLAQDRRPEKKMRTASGISDRTPSPNEQHHRAVLIPAELMSRPEFRLAFLLIITEKRTRLRAERAAGLRQNCGDRETVNNRSLGEGCQDDESLGKLIVFDQKANGDVLPANGTDYVVVDDGDDYSQVDEDRWGWDTRHQVHKTTAGNEELCVVPLEPGRTTVMAADDPGTEKVSQLKSLPNTDGATIADAEGSKEMFGQGGYRPTGGNLKSDVDKGPLKWDSRCAERTTVEAPDDPETDEFKQQNFLTSTEAATSADAEWFVGMDVVKQEVDSCLNSDVDKGAPKRDSGCVERTTIEAPVDPETDELEHLKFEAATYADPEGSEGGLEQGGYRPMDYEQGLQPLALADFPCNSDDVQSPLNLDTRRLEMPACAHEVVKDEGGDVIKSESTNDIDNIMLLSNPIPERDHTKQLEVGLPAESVSVTNTESVEVPSESIPETRSVLSGVTGNNPGNTHIAIYSYQKLAATKDPSTDAHVEVSAALFPEGVSRPIDVAEPDCTTPGVVGQEPVMLPKMENEELVSKSEPETISSMIVSVPNVEENAARRRLTDKRSKPSRRGQSKALINPSDHIKIATPNRMNTRKRAAQLKRDREMIEALQVQPADDKSEVKRPKDKLEQYAGIGQCGVDSFGDEAHQAVRRETLDAQLAEKKVRKSSRLGARKSKSVKTGTENEEIDRVDSPDKKKKNSVDSIPEKDWMDHVLITPSHEEMMILSDAVKKKFGKRGSSWMNTLRYRTKWLEDSHLDLAMDVFRKRYKLVPHKFRGIGVAFLGTDFTTSWNAYYPKFLEDRKDGILTLPPDTFDYFYGTVEKTGQLKQVWVDEVSNLYCPLHIPKDHWVAMYVNFFERQITIWDCNIACKLPGQIEQAVKPYQDMFPATVKALRNDPGYSLEPFVCVRVNDGSVPQNLDGGGDCGVYTLKFIEWHAIGNEISDLKGKLSDSNIKGMRDRLALDIYNELKFYGQKTPVLRVPDLGMYENRVEGKRAEEKKPTI